MYVRSQDFLNNVCTNIIHMHKKQLNYYSGNYDQVSWHLLLGLPQHTLG